MSYIVVNTYVNIYGCVEDVLYNTYPKILDSIKNGLILEILSNIDLTGTLYAKTYYSSLEYMNKIKNESFSSLLELFKNNNIHRTEFLGKSGSMYKDIGYKFSMVNSKMAKL